MTEETKKCFRCERVLSIAEHFGTYTDKRMGIVRVRSNCKACRVRVEVKRNQDDGNEKHRAYCQKHYETHKEEKRAYNKVHLAKKTAENPQFKLRVQCSRYLNSMMSGGKIDEFVGCDTNQLIRWFAYQFGDEFSWENRAEVWSNDHVIPLSFFHLLDDDERKIACHWTNTRPFGKRENIIKSNKIQKEVILEHGQIIKRFLAENDGYQADAATRWWQGLELWYGNNPDNDEDFSTVLRRMIRSEGPSTSRATFND